MANIDSVQGGGADAGRTAFVDDATLNVLLGLKFVTECS